MPTLVDELKRLRRGRGVLAPNIEVLAGPGLRLVCGIAEQDGPAVVRQKLGRRLGELATRLPDDLGLALLAALAIHPDARHALLKDRMSWLAGRLGRDERTARRRADDACLLLAEAAAKAGPEDGWYVVSFDALVRLDSPAPSVQERRRIIATRDGLDEIVPSLSLPRHPTDRQRVHDVGASVLYGGRLVRRERPSESHFRFAIALPRVLRAGQVHDYGIELRIPPGQPMRPHYVFVPYRRCDRFELRIRFDPSRLPGRIWLVTGVPVRVVDDAQPSEETLRTDAAGEIHWEFRNLTQGLGYGVQWR
ncbi:MAG TPA: hypothetical protein VJT49_25955 [Amycolatopsis sp.]|uniref:hypothetical protein n=1 Tax=Amycolatopsis sp. TaxID=37632 RepID=UPI002B477FA5|nr:hypothetical protein [Amycolatopsis sp.]HKS48493.1 hypothetical protein [Amycolatopsis sp.]